MGSKKLSKLFLSQFANPLILLLLIASIVALLLGEVTDGLFIIAASVINAFFGFLMEYRASRALEALKTYLAPQAKVLRGGKELVIDASDLCHNDLFVIEAGDRVPADGPILEAYGLKVDQSSITGESLPQDLTIGKIVLAGSLVVAGRGVAKAKKVGEETGIGKIEKFVKEKEEVISPLEKRIVAFAKVLGLIILFLSLVIFILGLLLGYKAKTIFVTSVALTVSAIPEGLPIAVTCILAIGVWRMAKRKAIVKKLSAVESLGSVTIIAADKTGTLTKGEILAQELFLDGERFQVSGSGYKAKGEILKNGKKVNIANFPQLKKLLLAALLCNDARVRGESDTPVIIGDPSEAALVILAKKGGLDPENVRQNYPRIAEFPFDAKLRYMVTLHKVWEKDSSWAKQFLFVKGSPEKILLLCDKKIEKEALKKKASQMAKQGLRIFALAQREIEEEWKGIEKEKISGKLSFLGFVGFADPVREEAARTVQLAREAGIKVVMVTGDHPETARAIAKASGLNAGQLILGKELEKMGDDELARRVKETTIFAEITPDQKLKIIEAYRKNGEIVAMTGDGVNDAPALISADVGVGMGKIGTDVAKEASDIVITDDNLSTIYKAIEEGRVIFENLKKVVSYILAGTFAILATVLASVVLGLPLPLVPAQILWINIVTDTLPDIALAFEKKDQDVIREVVSPHKKILDGKSIYLVFLTSITLSVLLTLLFAFVFKKTQDLTFAQTLVFATIGFSTLIFVFSFRTLKRLFFEIPLFSNRALIFSIFLAFLVLLAGIYLPLFQKILRTVPLNILDWVVVILAAAFVLFVVETGKYLYIKFGEKLSIL
jgi:Ca2+-transporting ATPase